MKLTVCLFAIALLLSCNTTTKKVEKKEDKWSVKMANSVLERYDTLGYYNGRTRIGWSYDIAMLGMAIDKLGDIDKKYSDYLSTYMDGMVMEDGSVPRYRLDKFNIDLINPAKALFTEYKETRNKKYKKAIPQFVEQMKQHPKTQTGGFWHKKVYPNQMWLDGLYMGSPFLAQYAKEFNAPEWFDVVAKQITLVYEKTLDPKTGLLYHAWDESKQQKWSNPETGQSPNFWSRSMGWYVMAIVDVLDFMPEDHPQRAEIISILQKTCDALMKVQDPESGVWYQVLDQGNREGNYLEGSGTAMYIYAFAKGAKNGYLDKSYLDKANTAFDNMIKEFIKNDENGIISMVNICGACGLGGNPYRDGTYEYYINEKIVTNDCKGVAPFIFAAIELDR
ncbi:glycoside hydrolase family 88/105 protein [Plebeiibacterium sediminum]|uniref:Glycoside hydrolase family 88 protein n=1 Tax=Plebeiibacterium sediminum TaxID=2992112 RepID=A0AAE3M357_9BACT|nr:glycoside hydrolase family 88 protein [Plebeiobacterium sediminum]MCW3785945.1 glycoside hydrolase family 88 protein [Plebeiobacterium sediminum]